MSMQAGMVSFEESPWTGPASFPGYQGFSPALTGDLNGHMPQQTIGANVDLGPALVDVMTG